MTNSGWEMSVRKRVKIAILILGALIGILILARPVLRLGFTLLFNYHWRYIERNPERMIGRLERIFEVDFPKEIKEVRAARTRVSWDGVASFIVKFTAAPDVVESFVKVKNLEPYSRERDDRDSGTPKPQWFTEPIKQGKTGDIYLSSRQDKTVFRGEIYVDNADEKNFVIYIRGGYESRWDK